MNDMSSERRLNPRMEINGNMTYHTGDSDEIRQGELENLSLHGARIWIDQELPADSQLHIRVVANDVEEQSMEFKATLLHKLPQRKMSMHGYGCIIEETEGSTS